VPPEKGNENTRKPAGCDFGVRYLGETLKNERKEEVSCVRTNLPRGGCRDKEVYQMDRYCEFHTRNKEKGREDKIPRGK